jgi:hypothetical protein
MLFTLTHPDDKVADGAPYVIIEHPDCWAMSAEARGRLIAVGHMPGRVFRGLPTAECAIFTDRLNGKADTLDRLFSEAHPVALAYTANAAAANARR